MGKRRTPQRLEPRKTMEGDTYALDFGRFSDLKMKVTPRDRRLILGLAIGLAVSLQIYDRLEQYEAEFQTPSSTHNMTGGTDVTDWGV